MFHAAQSLDVDLYSLQIFSYVSGSMCKLCTVCRKSLSYVANIIFFIVKCGIAHLGFSVQCVILRLGIILIPRLPVPNFICFATFTALARGEKSCTQSITKSLIQLI